MLSHDGMFQHAKIAQREIWQTSGAAERNKLKNCMAETSLDSTKKLQIYSQIFLPDCPLSAYKLFEG